MQLHSSSPNPAEEDPRQWQTQPATGEVVGGCELSTLGAVLLDAKRGAETSPAVYFTGVRVDYGRDGGDAYFRVISTHGSPVTELVPACELRVAFPVEELADVAQFLEDSVRRMVPEVEFVKRTWRDRARKDAAEALAAEGRTFWQGLRSRTE